MSEIFDFDVLKAQVSQEIFRAVEGVLEGASEDMATFATAIARNLVTVAQMPDNEERQALYDELMGQIQLIAEQNRLRAVNNTWNVVTRIVTLATNIATTVIRNAYVAAA